MENVVRESMEHAHGEGEKTGFFLLLFLGGRS